MDRLYLKKNWDKPLSWDDIYDKTPTANFYFINNETSKIFQEFIKNKERGSLLLSGDFGVGKTSSTIFNILESKSDKLPVVLNILEFDTLKKGDYVSPLNLLNVLKQMAINLSEELPKLEKQIGKTPFLDIKGLRWFKIKNKKDKDFNLNLIKICNKVDSFLFDITVTEISYIEKNKNITSEENINSMEAMIDSNISATKATPLLKSTGKISSRLSKKNVNKIKNEADTEIFRKRMGSTLDGITNKFIKILKDLEKSLNVQLIFIIDELDCYDKNSNLILDSLKKIKNLITLSNIQFIFIVGKNTYKTSLSEESYNTLFSNRVYINRPSGELFSKYLDTVLINVPATDSIKNINWEVFKWYLIARSKGNFYNLIQNIKSEIEFDKKNKAYIKIPSMKIKQSTLSAIYYALNTIYKYYLPEVKSTHLHDVLHVELESIVSSYLNWTPINKEPIVYLNSCETNLAKNTILTHEERNMLSQAKRALITYLYKICEIDNSELDNFENDDFIIDWSTIQENLSFKDVLQGISGAITKEEQEFRSAYASLLGKIAKYLKLMKINYDIFSFEELITPLDGYTYISYPDNAIGKIIEINRTINDIPLHERKNSLEDINEGILAVGTLSDYLSNHLLIYKTLLIEKHWGEIEIENDKFILKGSPEEKPVPLNSKLLIRNNSKVTNQIKTFNLSFKVKLSKGTLINILLGIGNPEDNNFYMGRFDSRGEGNDIRSAVLQRKPPENWHHVPMQLDKYQPFPEEKEVDVKCSYDGKKILGEMKIGRSYVRVFEYEIENLLLNYVGLGNELGEVIISNLKFKTK